MNVKQIRRENARALAKSVGGISDFALKLNKAQSQISHLIGCSPIKSIGDKVATQIEAAFDKPVGWLDKEHYFVEGAPVAYENEEGQSAMLCSQIPLINWQDVKEWSHRFPDGCPPKNIPQRVTTTSKVSALAFALRVQGESMASPLGISFPDGSIIIADPDAVATLESFVVVSMSPHQEAVLRQLVSDGNKRYIKPLNPHYPILEYSMGTTIYGVVKQLIMNFN